MQTGDAARELVGGIKKGGIAIGHLNVFGQHRLRYRLVCERQPVAFLQQFSGMPGPNSPVARQSSNDAEHFAFSVYPESIRHEQVRNDIVVVPCVQRDVSTRFCDGSIDSVNEWIWKKRNQGLSWITVKNILRTMQRVLSSFSKDKKPPFSQIGLAIPERDKLQMKVSSRKKISFSWTQAEQIAAYVGKMKTLGQKRREQYATFFLLGSASGLRASELLALRVNDIDFRAGTIRVEESSDQKSKGAPGPCKNAAAYRTVLLHDPEGRKAMQKLRLFLGIAPNSTMFVFHSSRGNPLLETNILNQGLYPALDALGLEQAGMHAFRRGCNRRWELAGVKPAIIRQQMGHSSAAMTERYTGEIPLDDVRTEFSMKFGNKIDVLEIMETGAAA